MLTRFMLFLLVFCCLSTVVYSADVTLHLDLPKEILSIKPLKMNVLKRYKLASDEIKKNAEEVKKQRPGYSSSLSLETKWQVTFENTTVISVSGMTYEYQGGAHPNTYYEAIVWDKKSQREIPLSSLFYANKSDLAFKAIAEAAQKSWIKIYSERSHEAPNPDLIEQAKEGIKPDAVSLKNYVLTHAKGQTKANGIMLLYGAGEIWPHVLGEFRIPVPQAVFYQYLKLEWRRVFPLTPEDKSERR